MQAPSQITRSIGVIFLLAAPMVTAFTGANEPGNPSFEQSFAYHWGDTIHGLELKDESGTLLIARDGEFLHILETED